MGALIILDPEYPTVFLFGFLWFKRLVGTGKFNLSFLWLIGEVSNYLYYFGGS